MVSLCFCLSANAQEVNLGDFDYLKTATSVKVHLIPSDKNMADVNMIRGDYDDLIIEEKNGILKIKFKNKMWGIGGNKNKAEIDLYYTTLKGVDTSSGSSVTSEGIIKAEDFHVESSSGSSCTIELDATNVEGDVSSGSRIQIRGEADNLEVEASSGSSWDSYRLKTKKVIASASSGSSIRVYADKSIEAEASSGASVKYKGDPVNENIDVGKYSGGSVSKAK